ncbi:MAG TPA: acyltransferase [Thermodesulfobacteriota bacterium]|nr:acyltransferase [Thermodesulfobacteriota bacterium]
MGFAQDVFIHETAEVADDATIGEGTRIWHQAQVRPGASIGKKCRIGKGVYIDGGVSIGNNCKIQNYVSVYRGVTVEDDVILGPHMTFTNDLYPRAFIDNFTVYETVIKKGGSVGANATIVCGVTLHEFCMIAAGAVVLSDVPAFALVVGNPGRVTGYVCRCGRKLDIEKTPTQTVEAKIVVCRACGLEYTLQLGLIPVL